MPNFDPVTEAKTADCAESLGAWLRAQRIAHHWSAFEMARQLRQAAKAAGDNTVTSAAFIASYVRRWERGQFAPTERYRLHYCAVLNIPLSEFGPSQVPAPAEDMSASAGNGSTPPVNTSHTSNVNVNVVVAVIPPGCQEVVIRFPDTASTLATDRPDPGTG